MSEELIKRIERLESENKILNSMFEKLLKMFDNIMTFMEANNKINQVILDTKTGKGPGELNN